MPSQAITRIVLPWPWLRTTVAFESDMIAGFPSFGCVSRCDASERGGARMGPWTHAPGCARPTVKPLRVRRESGGPDAGWS
ncbi:hypothetical protein GCM10009819_04810 [Agromyces tropicus]|uniref:Uncharacterized protein n=1 Tax=Agromyces tropicus TaxID=555371 RepID=A0ABN2TY11_9MICO